MAKILLVEDDFSIVEMYKLKFANSKHELLTATDGATGFELVKKEKPDLVLLDILMPKKTGFDVVKEMREDPELKDIKVIMLTNLGNETTQAQLEKMGVKDYIIKANYTPSEVLEYVDKVLKRKS